MSFATGGQVPVPPMGWIPTDPPPGTMPPMRPPPAGLGPPAGGARKSRGRCFRCNQPGHYIAECQVPPAHTNIAAQITSPPAPTAQTPRPMALAMVRLRTPFGCPTVAAGRSRHATAVVGIPLPASILVEFLSPDGQRQLCAFVRPASSHQAVCAARQGC